MGEIRLEEAEVTSATIIQNAIDALGEEGGRVILPAMDLVVDRGIEMRSNVSLVGQGGETVLHQAPGRIYPLSGYHNYGMLDVPLMYTEGLEPGMTVTIRDNRHGGFFETFARITWVEGSWVGIDQGLHSDYHADEDPVLVTAFPIIYGLGVENVSVVGITLDGHGENQPAGIGACRGAAVYFLRSHGLRMANVVAANFAGEGIGYQMCSQIDLHECRATGNAGNGFHPGAGSTGSSYEGCTADKNGAAGFFFCVRANHISVRGCTFVENAGAGISVGTRDNNNLIDGCTIRANAGPGILFRETRRPVEVRSCRVRHCDIEANAHGHGSGQIAIEGDARDLALEGNTIVGAPERERAGIHVAPSASSIWLAQNDIRGCFPSVVADDISLAPADPVTECGFETVTLSHYRHLGR